MRKIKGVNEVQVGESILKIKEAKAIVDERQQNTYNLG